MSDEHAEGSHQMIFHDPPKTIAQEVWNVSILNVIVVGTVFAVIALASEDVTLLEGLAGTLAVVITFAAYYWTRHGHRYP